MVDQPFQKQSPHGVQASLGYIPDRISRGGSTGAGSIVASGSSSNVTVDIAPNLLTIILGGMGVVQDGEDGQDGMTVLASNGVTPAYVSARILAGV